jgi:hypothetical protein
VLGVIDSLSAGYRFLGRRLELLLVPVLLDLMLWFAPRLSVAPLLEQLSAFYNRAAQVEGMPQDMVELSRQVSALLTATGDKSNLLNMLVNNLLLHVPSLLVTLGPLVSGEIWQIASPWTALAYAGLFAALGILIGVIYMDMLARRLPLGGAKPLTSSQFLTTVLRHWLMVVLFVLMIAMMLLIGSIPVLLGTAIVALISPTLGSFLMVLMSGAVFVLLFYLYFVTAAMILDNLSPYAAIVRSFVLVRRNFWASLGFFGLTTYVIAPGIVMTMRSLAQMTPLGTLAAILINAYIGSGLAMALLVFYRTRVLRDEGMNDKVTR